MGAPRNKSTLRRQVHRALRLWHSPTRLGLEPFLELRRFRHQGLQPRQRAIDARLTLNVILRGYIQELGQLQPGIRHVLLRRFVERAPTKELALELNISQETVNRMQAAGIRYLAELIWDDERLARGGI